MLTIAAYSAGAAIVAGAGILLLINIGAVNQGVAKIISVLTPVIWGVVIAYLLNPLCDVFEYRVFRRLFKKSAAKGRGAVRHIRTVSVILTVLVTLALLTWFFWLALPQLVSSVLSVADKLQALPVYFENIQQWIGETFGFSSKAFVILSNPLDELGDFLSDLWGNVSPHILPTLTNIGSGAINAFSGIASFVMGFVIGVNFLLAKGMIVMQMRKAMFAIFGKDTCQAVFGILGRSNSIFRQYMTGIITDGCIIGILCFIGALIIGVPSPLLLAVIIAVTNFIPFFGPMIGAAATTLVVLIDDPVKALWFLGFVVLLQQFDGNVMVPLIQGDATGVPSVWILVAIISGGGFFGLVGVIVAVPVFAVIYLLCKEWVEYRLRKKQLPTDSLAYESKEDVDSYVSGEDNGDKFSHMLADLDEKPKEKSLVQRIAAKLKKK